MGVSAGAGVVFAPGFGPFVGLFVVLFNVVGAGVDVGGGVFVILIGVVAAVVWCGSLFHSLVLVRAFACSLLYSAVFVCGRSSVCCAFGAGDVLVCSLFSSYLLVSHWRWCCVVVI